MWGQTGQGRGEGLCWGAGWWGGEGLGGVWGGSQPGVPLVTGLALSSSSPVPGAAAHPGPPGAATPGFSQPLRLRCTSWLDGTCKM